MSEQLVYNNSKHRCSNIDFFLSFFQFNFILFNFQLGDFSTKYGNLSDPFSQSISE